MKRQLCMLHGIASRDRLHWRLAHSLQKPLLQVQGRGSWLCLYVLASAHELCMPHLLSCLLICKSLPWR